MDAGSETPVGFGLGAAGDDNAKDWVLARMQPFSRLLEPIGAGKISWGGGGADISPLMRRGVPGFGLRTVGRRYFDWHHTHADTLDKINIEDFRKNIAALAVLSYVLADMHQAFPEFLSETHQTPAGKK